MSLWQNLLGPQKLVAPWIGGHRLQLGPRAWTIVGYIPREHGWYEFTTRGKRAEMTGVGHADPDVSLFIETFKGFLVGDRFLGPEAAQPTVWLTEPCERFAHVTVGRVYEHGPLLFGSAAWPVGPEEEVRQAYEDQVTSLAHIKGVTPALEGAWRFAVMQRQMLERNRAAAAERRRREEEAMVTAALAQQRLGDAPGRRALALIDFGAAARQALSMSDSELLDWRAGEPHEFIVRFRIRRLARRFECIVDNQLRVIDSGICLRAEFTDEFFQAGFRGDLLLTLESLPATILAAEREGKLVVLRR